MKLLRYGEKGSERTGMLDGEGRIRDLWDHIPELAGNAVSLDALGKLDNLRADDLEEVSGEPRLGACLAWVPNFHCIGLNYGKHAAETGAEPPREPILFGKATTALSGPNDDVIIPKNSQKADWEVELGVVIGRDVEHVSETEALDCVSAYCLVNDVSERAFQIERGGQWIKGKSAPTFGPIGPWLVTADEVADPQNLDLWLNLNGEKAQSSNTADMIFSCAEIISYMSRFMALRAGDIISTGTPEGVGMGMSPQRFLRDGDEMHLGIAGLGEQRQTARAFGG